MCLLALTHVIVFVYQIDVLALRISALLDNSGSACCCGLWLAYDLKSYKQLWRLRLV